MPRSFTFYFFAIVLLSISIPAHAETAKRRQPPSPGSVPAQDSQAADNAKQPEETRLKDPAKAFGKSGFCLDCHREATPAIFSEWAKSPHSRAKVGCAACHGAVKGEPDAVLHVDKFYISAIVTPFDCSQCHREQMRDYNTSGHARALDMLLDMKDDNPARPVAGQYAENDFSRCGGCHGVKVTVDDEHYPNPGQWPNSGAGRINPDKSHGTCGSCHSGHRFSLAAARHPQTCIRCHGGANYPEGEIYRNSLHGSLFETLTDREDMDLPGFYFTAKEMVSPTCAFCHLNGSGSGLTTRHNPAWRLPRDLTSPLAPEAARADNLRKNMKAVCNSCHAPAMVERFFNQADKELLDYQQAVAKPKLIAFQSRLAKATGEKKQRIIEEYANFLAESKGYRLDLYMGRHGRGQR